MAHTNEDTLPTRDWSTLDESFRDELPAIVERLKRRQYTPEPPYKGVCGIPVPSGLVATLQYRCLCGSIRCKVLGVVAGVGLIHQPVTCLKCGATDLVFERLDIGAV